MLIKLPYFDIFVDNLIKNVHVWYIQEVDNSEYLSNKICTPVGLKGI